MPRPFWFIPALFALLFGLAVLAHADTYTITADPADLAHAAAQDPNKPRPNEFLQAYVDAWLQGQKQARLAAEEQDMIQARKDCLALNKGFLVRIDLATGKIVGACQ